MKPKPFYKSLTFWSLLATLLGLALAGIGQGRPLLDLLGDASVQATLGEILTALGAGGVVLGRVRAQGPLTMGRGKGERGSVKLGALVAMFLAVGILVAALIGGGCASTTAERSLTFQRRPGPTCLVRLLVDGELDREVTAPFPCVPPPEFCEPGPGERP